MPKTHRHAASTTQESDNNGFDHNTPSTWHLASLEQLHTTTVATLQKELRSRNLPLKGNKSVLSSHLYQSLHPTTSDEGSPSSNQGGTSMASSVTTTATLRHSNQTTCQTGASNETFRLLSSQLQSLPQQQLTSLVIQAISANSLQTITPNLQRL